MTNSSVCHSINRLVFLYNGNNCFVFVRKGVKHLLIVIFFPFLGKSHWAIENCTTRRCCHQKLCHICFDWQHLWWIHRLYQRISNKKGGALLMIWKVFSILAIWYGKKLIVQQEQEMWLSSFLWLLITFTTSVWDIEEFWDILNCLYRVVHG